MTRACQTGTTILNYLAGTTNITTAIQRSARWRQINLENQLKYLERNKVVHELGLFEKTSNGTISDYRIDRVELEGDAIKVYEMKTFKGTTGNLKKQHVDQVTKYGLILKAALLKQKGVLCETAKEIRLYTWHVEQKDAIRAIRKHRRDSKQEVFLTGACVHHKTVPLM